MPAPLEFVLDGDTNLTVTRHFAATPDLVFRAHTDCALMQRWMLGPPGWSMPGCEMDPRPGGAYRHDYAGPDGEEFSIVGEIIEIEPNRRIRHVEYMLVPERTPDNNLETLFEAAEGGTRLTLRMTLPDAAAREAMLATGMMEGMELAYQSLDDLVEANDV
ncbi:MAG TPA: hypothetical protein DIU07_14505 [Rhodobacteraceae bacterium]|nr:hypothetical protein [Paracoccaceae bacterium]